MSDQSWHHRSFGDTLKGLETSREGLSDDEATRRFDEHGPNTLEAVDKPSLLRRLFRQFHDVLIYILIFAAGLTAYLQEWVDTAVIAAVVVLNAVIGFVQEGKAEEALEEIRQMLTPEATVIRDGHRRTIDAERLVPGDVVWLESGDRVPADVRLVEAKNLEVEEALLTGESEPVTKSVEPVEEDAPLGDRLSMAFSGTVVVRGTARAVVVATGTATEVGRIGEMVAGVEQLKTPLIRKIDTFGLWLSAIILAVAAALFAFGWFFRPYGITDLFMLVVSLSVAAIPEGLPAIMTITLALGVRRMAERNAIIRKLPAVETLGSVTVICSDKTGTLTRNEMTARALATAERDFQIHGEGTDPEGHLEADGERVHLDDEPVVGELARAAALCNDAELVDDQGRWRIEGEPTEGALVVMAERAGLDRKSEAASYRRLDTVPFESERRYMATLHEGPDSERIVYLKGAPETVLAICSKQKTADGTEPLDPDHWNEASDQLAGEGYRVLAVARRIADADSESLTPMEIDGEFEMLGFVAMMDPPRPEAIAAVSQAQRAGVRVKMITGDHVETARTIGERMNIGVDRQPITGREIEDADDEKLDEIVEDHDVFARTSPEHKLRVVEALQRNKEVVAMTGDGVNDAPALKRADVGVAMGIKGTEATKQAADMVLADDNFSSIERAISEGRTIYDNLKKTILFLLPTNGAEALMILAAVLLAYEYLPITPVQILWVNMVTAVTLALALAFEPAEEGVMERPPRPPGEAVVNRYGIARISVVALLIGGLALASFFGARSDGATIELARTIAVNTLVAGQLFYLFSSRFLVEAAYLPRRLFANRIALVAVLALIVAQIVFTYTPAFQTWFETRGLTVDHWLRIVGSGLLVFVVVELEKAVMRRFSGDKGPTP